jgi:hypothetical protein
VPLSERMHLLVKSDWYIKSVRTGSNDDAKQAADDAGAQAADTGTPTHRRHDASP